jgi:hypothetical protein
MSDQNTCSAPPALTDEELTAYLVGKAEKHIEAHLEACAFCRAQLENIRYGQVLSTALYRLDCPDTQQLTDYSLEMLPAYERETIAKHLEFCLVCQDEIKLLQDFLAIEVEEDQPLPQTLWTQPKRPHPKDHVARVLQIPMASELRGRLKGPILASISDSLSVFFEYNESVQATTLKGQIVAADLTEWESAMVAIFRNLNLIATTTVDDLGAFQCDLSAIVPVQIRITAPSGETISIPELILDEDG